MKNILMCDPNISEGKDKKIIDEITSSIKKSGGIKILEVLPDEDHNRTVYAYLGEKQDVVQATKNMAELTFEMIDMQKHKGDHPRLGALDVVPFIPVGGTEMSEAVEAAKEFGKFAGDKGIPVYYYEDAATRPERKNLVNIRKGQYEGLAEKIKDPEWTPDEGPAEFVAKTGAVMTGARMPLVAFNVNLNTTDLSVAKAIADAVRHSKGGFRYVRAIGLRIKEKDQVQVSMNLTDYPKTPPSIVMESIRAQAKRYGVNITGAELVGPVPLAFMEDIMANYLHVHDFSINQFIETNLID